MFRKKEHVEECPIFLTVKGFQKMLHMCVLVYSVQMGRHLSEECCKQHFWKQTETQQCGSHQPSPKLMKNPRLGLGAKEKCLLIAFHCTWNRKGWRQNWGSLQTATRVLSPFCMHREPALAFLAVISAISCTHTHLQLNLLTRSWIFSTISAQTALTPRSSCFGVQTQPRACGCMEPCCWHWMLQCMARAFYAVALYACKGNIIAQILQIFLLGSISGTSILCVSPPGGSPWALPLGISPVWFPAEQPELGWCYVLWSAICWNFVLLLFQWRMVLLAQEMDKGCPDWHLTCELSAQCKQLEGGVWTAEIICVP